MIDIEILDSREFAVSRWSGGVTTELFIAPEGASYAERRFEVRISTAEVMLESSVFTRLDGVTRFLTPLCEKGFVLKLNSLPERRLLPGEVLCFSGGDEVLCRGVGRDLNLMLKGRQGDMHFADGGSELFIPDAEYVFVYAVDDGLMIEQPADGGEEGSPFVMCAGDFARVHGSGFLRTHGRAVLFVVY